MLNYRFVPMAALLCAGLSSLPLHAQRTTPGAEPSPCDAFLLEQNIAAQEDHSAWTEHAQGEVTWRVPPQFRRTSQQGNRQVWDEVFQRGREVVIVSMSRDPMGAGPLNPSCPARIGGRAAIVGSTVLKDFQRGMFNSLQLTGTQRLVVAEWRMEDGRMLRVYVLGRNDRTLRSIRTAIWTVGFAAPTGS